MYASVSTLYNFSWKKYGLREGWVQKFQSMICAVFSVVCIGVLDQGGHVTINLSRGLIDACTLEKSVQKWNFEPLDSTLKIQIAKYTNTCVPNTCFCAFMSNGAQFDCFSALKNKNEKNWFWPGSGLCLGIVIWNIRPYWWSLSSALLQNPLRWT